MLGIVDMPYMGVGIFDGVNKIIIKVHGPFDTYNLSSRELRESAEAIWDLHTTKAHDTAIRVQELADQLRDIFCDGVDIIWVQVEYQSPSDGGIFGASAERILSEAA
jgi:hypothetical protein